MNSIEIMGTVTCDDIKSTAKQAFVDILQDINKSNSNKEKFLNLLSEIFPEAEDDNLRDMSVGFQIALVYAQQKGYLNVPDKTETINPESVD